MDLTTRIFRDLATLANWAFQCAICKAGAYGLAEVAKNKNGNFSLDKSKLQTATLPGCATWHDESEYIVKLSYNGGMQEYTFEIGNVFALLAKFKKIAAEGITAKEKNELCMMTKREKATGELLAVVEMPKAKTKQVAKAVNKDSLYLECIGVYVDKTGYIVATDGHILNACKVNGVFEPDFTGAILPTEFAKRADGCTVEIYKDGDIITAYCGDEKVECINRRFPNWRSVIGKVCEKGHIEVKFADLKKAAGKDEAVTLSTCGDGMTVSTYNQYNAPDITERHTQIDAEHNITDFAISTCTEYIKKVMPCCNDMYVKSRVHAIVFVGDGCLSLIMPLDNQNLAYNDLTDGETLVSAFDIMNGVTVCDDTNKKDITVEVATVTTVENVTGEQTETDAATTDTGKELNEQRTESGCTIITIHIANGIWQNATQRFCERVATLRHAGGLSHETFRRMARGRMAYMEFCRHGVAVGTRRRNAVFCRSRRFAADVGNYSTTAKGTPQTASSHKRKRRSCRGSPASKVQTGCKQETSIKIQHNNTDKESNMKKIEYTARFEVGRVYECRSIMEPDKVFQFKVIGRSKCRITFQDVHFGGIVTASPVRLDKAVLVDVERVYPFGRRAGRPILSAANVVETEEKQEVKQ